MADVGKVVDKVDDVVDTRKVDLSSKNLTDKISSKLVNSEDIVYSDKFKKPQFKNQVTKRGWDEQKIADTINNPVKTTKKYNKYTDSTVTNYYINDTHYVAIDDSNGKVIQISDLTKTKWKN